MSDEIDWDFSGPDNAKAEIRAAVGYLLKDAAGSDRSDHCDRERGSARPAGWWRWHARWLGAGRKPSAGCQGFMGSARAASPLALPIAPAIARGNQFFLKLQSFVGRHGRLLALRRQILYGRITACFRACRGFGARVHQ